ncbi:hypothetical protein [Phenylobacterium sp.]|jgi:hypothetical protein|uniref:hypothetical protein n=1 Tax=Phenylobacterium sp. TaxID=1871053 RepID=UPI002F95808F
MGEQTRRMVEGGADPAASDDPAAAPGLADAPHTATPARWPDDPPADAAPPPADTDEQSQLERQAGHTPPA